MSKNMKSFSQPKIFLSLFFALLCTLFSQRVHAQVGKVTINRQNVAVKTVLNDIESQTHYLFIYGQEVNVSRKVTLKVKKQPLNKVLSLLFDGQQVKYTTKGEHIILSVIDTKSPSAINKNQHTTTPGNTVKASGVVVDTEGEPIIGATIKRPGSNTGTVTDVDGHFSIEVPKGSVLQVSYIGYEDSQFKASTNMNIKLKSNVEDLNEVVVIGYGAVKKVNLGGAVSTADEKVFNSRSVTDATSALQGEVPGLTIIRNSGDLEDQNTLRIRDISSINGGSPLVLIDGAVGDLNQINPADIENISVLKDGTAAIYGARAADGVILVTTKSGHKNQPVMVSFDANAALKTPALLRRPASLYEHAAMCLEITDGSFPIEYSKDDLELIKQGSDRVDLHAPFGRWGTAYAKFYKNQDWNDIVIGNGYQENYNVNISGGGDRYNFMVSMGYQRQKGIVKFGKDTDNKYYVRAKATADLLRNLKYDINISYEADDHDYSSGINEGQTIWELIYKTRSWAPLRNPAGNFYVFEGFDNPAQVLEEGGINNKTSGNFTFNNQLTWKPFDGLSVIGQAVLRKYDYDKSVKNKYIHEYNWENDLNYREARKPNSARREYSKSVYRNFTLYGEYKHTFAKIHDISLMLGTSHESESYDAFSAQRINFDPQTNMSLSLGSSENQTANESGYDWTINSFFGRLNYTLANRYIVEGTLRTDGSSRFASGHRWGWFPGVNAAWRIAEESFMKHQNILDDLKLRVSYGEMGNQSGIGYYDYVPLIIYSSSYYPFGDGKKGTIANASTLTSTERTWETIRTTNTGVDFALLRNRLYGSFDYYWKKNTNMLIPVTYPSLLGADAPSTNSGELKVNGWEVNLGWRDHIHDFTYDINVNLSDSKNKVMNRIGSNLISLGLNSAPTGYPINSFFGYEFDGIIQTEEQLEAYKARFSNGGIPGDLTVGDAMYKDLDGDGKLTVLGDGTKGSGDVKYLGDQNPRYNFGVNIKMGWKGFDFSVFLQGVGRRTMFLQGEADKPMSQPWYQSASYWYGKTWTSERTDAKYPAVTLKEKRYYNYYYSTNTKFSVAYARMKNLQFGYTFPKSLLSKCGIQRLRVYFSGENLAEIHNTPGGWDPEENGSYWNYPFTRNYSIGLNLTF